MDNKLVKWLNYISFWCMVFFLAVFIAGEFAVKGIGNFWFSKDIVALFFVKVIGAIIGAYFIIIFSLKKDFIKYNFHWILIAAIAIFIAILVSVETKLNALLIIMKLLLIVGPITILYVIKKYQKIKIKWYYYLIFVIVCFLAYSSFSPIEIRPGLYFGL